MMSIDSSPSDALALALRVNWPIFVEDGVLKSSKISSAISEKSTSEELRMWLERLGMSMTVVISGGFTRFRRAAETPFNIVYEARP